MSKKLLIAVLGSLFAGNSMGYASIGDNVSIENPAEANVNIENLLQEYLENTGTPGAAVALIDHGKVQFFCVGKMAVEGKPVTEETLFEIGSITKVFTTLALMDSVGRGMMQLDDPIEMYLPGVRVPEFEGKKITLRHLATHTSGIPRMPDHFSPKDPANPFQDFTVESLYNCLQLCTLEKIPGDSFVYSNVGMGLLGHILSIRSGKSYEDLIKALIVNPLNMQNTSIALSGEAAANFACGHQMRQAVSQWDIAPALAGAGAFRSTIKDMANFLAANMEEIASPLSSTLQKCHEKHYVVNSDTAFGLGWILSKTATSELIWHNGCTGGFWSYLGFNPKTEKGVVILSNSTEDWPDKLGSLILDSAAPKCGR